MPRPEASKSGQNATKSTNAGAAKKAAPVTVNLLSLSEPAALPQSQISVSQATAPLAQQSNVLQNPPGRPTKQDQIPDVSLGTLKVTC